MSLSFTENLPLLAAGSNAALIVFLIYILAVFGLAAISNKLLQSKNFLSEYFLGSRSLGVWAFALTFAATSASGGSFTGFPSKVYTHGWILGLWIGSYIVVPICAMGLLGKRLNQVARISGSITVPDVLRDRFHSTKFGLLAVSLIVFFMSFNLVAQFKSGSEILKTLLQDVDAFNTSVGWVASFQESYKFLPGVDPAYLLCLGTFAVAVVIYTTYGGFHAVVWTDVMQGVVMVVGVLIMLPLAIWQVGGLNNATEKLAEMTPPRLGLIRIEVEKPPESSFSVSSPWFMMPGEKEDLPRLFRVSRTLAVSAEASHVDHIQVVELTTPAEIHRQLDRLVTEEEIADLKSLLAELKNRPVIWLSRSVNEQLGSNTQVILTLNKGYRYGGGQKGVYVTGPGPKPVSLPTDPGTLIVEPGQTDAQVSVYDEKDKLEVQRTSDGNKMWIALAAGKHTLKVNKEGFQEFSETFELKKDGSHTIQADLKPGGEKPAESAAPPKTKPMDGFLPLSLAISFFFMWAISGAGQPSSMVRLMAFNNTVTLRRSIFTVAIYYSMIYFPLVIIFCCARVILPGMDLESDRIMPQMAVTLTTSIGQGWLAGLLVAAPFAAVMSTVDSFLLMISSALVRDIYQRNINPEAKEKTLKLMSYVFTLLVGTGAMLGAINPPQFLQDIIVYTGSGLAACFLAPMTATLYWPRANATGCIGGMLAGFFAHLSMYIAGMFVNGSFYEPFKLFNFNPIIIGLFVSFVGVYVFTMMSPPPPKEIVRKYFYRKKENA